ncbi:hypothetical protein GCM10028807_02090 [Spirosoma daeguense]
MKAIRGIAVLNRVTVDSPPFVKWRVPACIFVGDPAVAASVALVYFFVQKIRNIYVTVAYKGQKWFLVFGVGVKEEAVLFVKIAVTFSLCMVLVNLKPQLYTRAIIQ